MKKKWEKPSLMVIVRNKPEEALLANCKGNTFTGGLDSSAGACRKAVCGGICLATGTS